jgi:hypothetical protein
VAHDGFSSVPDEIAIEPKIVEGQEAQDEDFTCQKQVPEVGA